ncbi:MAG TPA: helix-turn-helix domain-containing protein [Actinomycetota bacterium]|nr:helix-turn-helix domain-containing protein [Actinomycetota bacterium]
MTRRPLSEAQLATVSEVAALLRVSRMTVYRLIRQGDLPAVRIGRGYRIPEDDVDRYLDDRFTEAG